jgi:hypothetical protein
MRECFAPHCSKSYDASLPTGLVSVDDGIEGNEPLPNSSITRALASRLCPDRIMHPQPVSDVNLPWSTSWFLRRTESDIDGAAFGSWDLGIAGKLERYVSHTLASKSSKKEEGHPPSPPLAGSSYAEAGSRVLAVLSGGVRSGTRC